MTATSNDFNVILDDCVRMHESGASIEECVSRYPKHADELRELLGVAAGLRRQRQPLPPDPAVAAEARGQLLGAVAVQRTVDPAEEPTLALVAPLAAIGGALGRLPDLLPFGMRRIMFLPQALPAVLALVILSGAALAAAAVRGDGGVLPGFGGQSRSDEVELRGLVVAVDSAVGTMTVQTVSNTEVVQVTPDTELKDEAGRKLTLADFAEGTAVKVHASERDGGLVAREIEIEGVPATATALQTDTPVPPPPVEDNQVPGPNAGPGNADDDDRDDDDGQGDDDGEDDDDDDDRGRGRDGNDGRGRGNGRDDD